jgi:hypothetical protein
LANVFPPYASYKISLPVIVKPFGVNSPAKINIKIGEFYENSFDLYKENIVIEDLLTLTFILLTTLFLLHFRHPIKKFLLFIRHIVKKGQIS